VGNLEEVVSSGSSTSTTAYYYAGGQRIALSVNGVFSYLASAALGTPDVSLSASGSAQASRLYTPYVLEDPGQLPGLLDHPGAGG
jgi:hypothetical protein